MASEFFINLDLDSPDRCDLGKFMRFTDNYDPLTSNFIRSLSVIQPSGTYTVSGEFGRPDLLSYSIYGDVKYWWILLIYNKILEYDQINIGDVIKYPSLDDLENLYFSLKSKETVTTV